jgi:hypothetical protein
VPVRLSMAAESGLVPTLALATTVQPAVTFA